MVSETPPIREGVEPDRLTSTTMDNPPDPPTEWLVQGIIQADTTLTLEQSRELFEEFQRKYREMKGGNNGK